MDTATLWYGSALILTPIFAWGLAVLWRWFLPCAEIAGARWYAFLVFWGALSTIFTFAFVIDIASAPINKIWGLVILVNGVFWPPFWVWVRSHGRPVWVRKEE